MTRTGLLGYSCARAAFAAKVSAANQMEIFIADYHKRMQPLNRSHRPPAEPLPPHAADCHMHVFGPFDRFPLAAERAYNVPAAPLAAHERMKAQVGLERTVLVQASGHGTDNRAMLAALAELGPRGRGVAVV